MGFWFWVWERGRGGMESIFGMKKFCDGRWERRGEGRGVQVFSKRKKKWKKGKRWSLKPGIFAKSYMKIVSLTTAFSPPPRLFHRSQVHFHPIGLLNSHSLFEFHLSGRLRTAIQDRIVRFDFLSSLRYRDSDEWVPSDDILIGCFLPE